jgi:hypothetical protein
MTVAASPSSQTETGRISIIKRGDGSSVQCLGGKLDRTEEPPLVNASASLRG